MINKNTTFYTFGFALVVCFVCSLSLALVSEGLRPQREINEELDVKKNILKAVELQEPVPPSMPGPEILKLYEQKIEGRVIDHKGNVVAGKTPEEIKDGEELYPLYVYQEQDKVMAYALPVYGKGLWSTIYGYLALEADGITVRGITFYKHGETPGLGGEVEKAWFQDNFKGKKIWDSKTQSLRPVAVAKGKAADKIAKPEQKFYVDGISGATMTGKGVTEFLDEWVRVYDPYFQKIRNVKSEGVKEKE